MACLAIHDQMLLFQFEISLIMIKILDPSHCLERILTMALTAILPKLILMRIFMAAGAVAILYTSELLEFFALCNLNFMTFLTIHIFMLSRQPEFCIIVRKSCSRDKRILVMTIFTFR